MQLKTLIGVLQDNRPDVVVDVADEYGEPGYHADGPVLVGHWWCRCDGELHGIERHYPRVFSALVKARAKFLWADKWYVSHAGGSSKAYRT